MKFENVLNLIPIFILVKTPKDIEHRFYCSKTSHVETLTETPRMPP